MVADWILSPLLANSRARLPLRRSRCTLLPCSHTWARKYSLRKRWKTNFACFDSPDLREGIAEIIVAFRPSALCTLIMLYGGRMETVYAPAGRLLFSTVNVKGTVAVKSGRSWACTWTETAASSRTVVIRTRTFFIGVPPFQSAGESGCQFAHCAVRAERTMFWVWVASVLSLF